MIQIKLRTKMGIILLCVFIVGIYLSIYIMLKEEIEDKQSTKTINTLTEKVINNKEESKLEINWNQLKAINNDIIGWIYIKDTNINYPILRDNGDQYYLSHSFEKKKNRNGSVFTTNSNIVDIEESSVFGHNMKNGTQFADLQNYMNKEFFNQHKEFYVYTPTSNYQASIISVYQNDVYKENDIFRNLDFQDRVEYYIGKSIYKEEGITDVSKLIKLVTCSYQNAKDKPTEQRYFVIAALNKLDS